MQLMHNSKMLMAVAIMFTDFAMETSTSPYHIPNTVDAVSILCCATGVILICMAYLEEKKRLR
ncbi:MAG: hypothetical protein WCE61_22765 [Candidatus Acidiferrum sp.]